SELPESRVVALCDCRTERLQEVGRRSPQAVLTGDVEEVAQLTAVDVVVICTGATTHYDITRRCLAAGKHVLVEKPMTTTVADAEALIALADSRGVQLMVGHTFLYNPAIERMKQYLNQNDIGRVYYLYARRTNLGPIRHDVSALWDLAPHDVSIFNYLLDDTPIWVSAVGAKVLRNGQEDVGFITLGYRNGIVGNIHVSWADPNKVRELVVVGSNKRIVFDDTKILERVRIYEKGVAPVEPEAPTYGEFHFEMHDGDIISPRIEVSEPLKNQCLHFLTCVNQGARPLTDGQAGLEVVQVMAAVDRSIEQNGAPVAINGAELFEQRNRNHSSAAYYQPFAEAGQRGDLL
ncbi:MAG TPA: Gfo/Idh/MocA family oxidoreductase, partial [Anaerolineae bacterium]